MTQIVSKLKEAKGVKAYNTLQILAKHISQSYLLRLIIPFKDVSYDIFKYKKPNNTQRPIPFKNRFYRQPNPLR